MHTKEFTPKLQRDLVIGLLLFFVTFAFFSRVLFNDFVAFDDDQSVYRNQHVQGLDWERLKWMFKDVNHAVRYKPLTWLAYAVIHKFSGLHPFGYHLVSVFFHGLNTVLVFVIVRKLLALTAQPGQIGTRWREATLPAALGALVWALNPLRVEPVARVTDVTYCQSFFFLLISLWFYLCSVKDSAVNGDAICFIGAP